jgi:hypothetical protein
MAEIVERFVRMQDPVAMLMGEGVVDDQVAAARRLVGDEGIWSSAKQEAEFVYKLVKKFALDRAWNYLPHAIGK